MNSQPQERIGIAIKRIRTIQFSVWEHLVKGDFRTYPIRIDLQPLIGFNTPYNLVNLTIRVSFKYPENSESVLMDFRIENDFEVYNLVNYVKDTKLDLPEDVWLTMIGVSVGHARATLYNLTLGTQFNEVILPLADSGQLLEKLMLQR